MTKIEAKPRIIEGEWDWREIATNLSKGWVPILERPKGEHIWCFRADGMMISRENDRTLYVVAYKFDPRTLRLSLDGWQFDNNGERETLICERYRVEFPSPSEMLLYDLEDVEPDEEESLRLRFRKI